MYESRITYSPEQRNRIEDIVEAGTKNQDKLALLALRGIAWFIDMVVFVFSILKTQQMFGVPAAQADAEFWMLISFLFFLGGCEWLFGGTPGKLLLRIRVIDATGQRPGPIRAVMRRLLMAIDVIGGWLVGLICFWLSEHAQRVGDIWTRSYVVETRTLASIRTATAEGLDSPGVEKEGS